MPIEIDSYLARAYSTEIVPDEYTSGGMTYRASHPELPGCMAHGDTPSEARLNLDEARELYLRALLERGIEPPLPCASRLDIVWVSLGTTRHQDRDRTANASFQAVRSGRALRLDRTETAEQTKTSDILPRA